MGCNFKSYLSWVYPPLCLHCGHKLLEHGPLFCPLCLEWLTLVELRGRCGTCFKELDKSGCERCKARKRVIHRQMAAVESMGPARCLENASDKKCIEAAASLMAYQWLHAEKDLPHFLIPLPQTRLKKFLSKQDSAQLLAKALSKILNIPVLEALQARYDHRGFMCGEPMRTLFTVKHKKAALIMHQSILLISLTLEDSLLRAAGSALQLAYPAKIEALSYSCITET